MSSTDAGTATAPSVPAQHGPPADPELRWRHAGRALLAKTIGQFAYEDLLAPEPLDDAWHRLTLDGHDGAPSVEYRFRADRDVYGSWFVDPGSVRRAAHPAADPLAFVADAARTLGLPAETAAHLVRDLAATLAADAHLLATAPLTAAELADLDHTALEAHQAGDPSVVFDKGRYGYSAADALRYAPEARQPVRVPWIAVRDDLAHYQAVPGLSARRLYTEELSPAARVRFGAELIRHSCNPARYWWLPLHPWQWDEIIQPLYGAELASSRMVYLGEGDDAYLPQRSLGAFTNATATHRHDVCLPLSVRDAMAWHGLPAQRTQAAPTVTTWLHETAAADSFLADSGKLVLLGEVASVTVAHPVLDRIDHAPYQYRELLGAIWREPSAAALHPGERARGLSALLCLGADGRPLVAELVARSALPPAAWLERLCTALLQPLLRLLYVHGIALSPLTAAAAVIFDEREIPTRLAVTNLAESVALAAAGSVAHPAPGQAPALLPSLTTDFLCQSLHRGLFVGHLRHLARIFAQHLDTPAADFWSIVRDAIHAYQAHFPEHADRYRHLDLSTTHIDRYCPNRSLLLGDGYRDRPARLRPEPYGVTPNPLALPS
jgi:siderophore synthetase component